MQALFSLLEPLLSMLGASSGPADFGGLNPDDPEAYWNLQFDLEQGEHLPGGRDAAARKHGLKSNAHAEKVMAAYEAKYANGRDAFNQVGQQVITRRTQELMQQDPAQLAQQYAHWKEPGT